MQSIFNAQPTKVIVAMVGLPARGKSYISKKIYRYLNWLGFKTQVYNVGNYRRKYMIDNNMQLTTAFFDQDIQEYKKVRELVAEKALNDLINYINIQGNTVAIFDATNITRARRKFISEKLKEFVKQKYQIIFIESLCNDNEVVEGNIKKVKVHGLDFQGMSEQQATQQFRKRIQSYEKKYQTLTKQQGFSFLKTINVGQGFQVHRINGYLAEKIMNYTMNLTISPDRKIYLSRHGESLYNLEDRIGGDCDLSQNGIKFAQALPFVFKQLLTNEDEQNSIRVITSTLIRTQKTAQHLKINAFPNISLKLLDQLNAGICQNLTYAQIKQKHPNIHNQRSKNKISYRYPSGQSYLDVIGRLQPVICWIERQKYSVYVIAHQAIIRCIFSYFFNIDLNLMLYEIVPLHIIIRLTPQTYTFREQYISIDVQKKCIKNVMRPARKKYSIDHDGSSEHLKTQKMKQK